MIEPHEYPPGACILCKLTVWALVNVFIAELLLVLIIFVQRFSWGIFSSLGTGFD